MRLLLALGGNAMTAPDGTARPQDQQAAVERAMEAVADLVAAGHQVVLTHGNGPQVGNLLVKNELAADVVPPVPLDWCGAQTQGTIGLLMLDALDRCLAARGVPARPAVLVSRTLVDGADPGLVRPTKPIGRYLPATEAQAMIVHGQHWADRGERGWRRVVASPEPVECLDAPAAAALRAAGYIVVCSGGGGVPVVRAADGSLRGVEAVVDKDLAAVVLARALEVDVLLIVTDVEAVVTRWGSPAAAPVGAITAIELRRLAGAGHFAPGSMGPKVEAACRFAEGGGQRAVITSLDRIADAVAGTAGTIVTSAA